MALLNFFKKETFVIENGVLKKYKGKDSNVCIPSGVTSIGKGAFLFCSSITSVTIPNSVKTIGEGAFPATGLKSVVIPDSVTSIGNQAFEACFELTSITLPSTVSKIGETTFNGCKNLTIHAPAGSYAEQYAKEYGISFKAIQKNAPATTAAKAEKPATTSRTPSAPKNNPADFKTKKSDDGLTLEIDAAISAIIKVKEAYSNDKAYAVCFIPLRDEERSKILNKTVYRTEITVLVVDSLYKNDACAADFYDWFHLSKGDSAGYNTYSCITSNYCIGEYNTWEQTMKRYKSESETYAKYKQMPSMYE